MSRSDRYRGTQMRYGALLLLVLSACAGSSEPTGGTGGGGGGGAGGGGSPLATAVTVNMLISGEYGAASNSFSPGTVTIARNGTVTWSNESAVLHNVTFTVAGAPSNIPNTGAGNTGRVFPNAGSFPYQCTNHAGMSGSVTVAP